MSQAAVLAALSAVGCKSGMGPPAPIIPPLGSYVYAFTNPPDSNGVIGGRTFSGTLVLTYATVDSIAGRWEVPGYAPQPFGGARGLDPKLCVVGDTCPSSGQQAVGVARDDLPYELGAAVVDGTAADSTVPVRHFLFWHPDRVVCGASRAGLADGRLIQLLGTCTLQLPMSLGARNVP